MTSSINGQGVQTRTVKEKDNGIRLDKWFKLYFPNLKFAHLQKLLRSGQIRVNSKRIKASLRIETGQLIRVPPLDAEAASQKREENSINSYKISASDRHLLENIMIYQDDNIMAVNKPAGLAVQGGSKQRRHLDGIAASMAKENKQERPHLVHRLDKETSGVLLLAKHSDAAKRIGKMFKEQSLQKYYWAICIGKPEHEKGEITAPLLKGKSDYGEYMKVDEEEGKFSRTYYHVVEQLGKKLCWVVFKPLTGRTHQIRVHASLLGCPILGDMKYADPEEQECFTEIIPKGSIELHLHAQQLILPNPYHDSSTGRKTNKELNISADLPPHMSKTWKDLGLDAKDINNESYFDD